MMTNFDDFQTWLTEQDRSEKTIHGYLADLARFATWFEQTNHDELTPLRLTPTDIRAYARWALDSGQSSSDQARGIRPVQSQKLAPKWLDRRQQNALVSVAEKGLNAAQTESARMLAQRDLCVVVTLLHTGLRISELCDLNQADVIMSAKKGKLVVRQGKGERRREVPLNQEAREALSAWHLIRGDDGSLLFSGKRGEGISVSGVHRRLAELGRIARVEVHAHTLRHTFAKNLIDAGVSLEKVASLLGHSSLNTTRIYITPGERDLEAAVGRLAG